MSKEHSALPPGWEVRMSSKHNRPYYFNTESKESRWEPPPARDQKLGAKHILVKHEGSRRPSSWREETITRTEAEAVDMINAILQRLISKDKPERFEDIAAAESDCSSAKRGGDLGLFEPGAMQKPFEDAVLGLKVGKISGPVKTQSGVHIILRTR
ncbi:Peptidyl-prolyl cis-trans isomerase NIMA-interacting protein 1 [Coemansia nantahalensis]|uniref:Peptidyl-prolyl cis-trans isomerase NIMA-interacting protein 1 n=1 Tax=Coemansia nantahalensis TaxID=2789366 RepID=A0ACC1JS13_9FUNG|nr:Peptidyl-prolyl cis-trans isomerase NIMA-interacting protein 1 [Coemansia nantahalensis]